MRVIRPRAAILALTATTLLAVLVGCGAATSGTPTSADDPTSTSESSDTTEHDILGGADRDTGLLQHGSLQAADA